MERMNATEHTLQAEITRLETELTKYNAYFCNFAKLETKQALCYSVMFSLKFKRTFVIFDVEKVHYKGGAENILYAFADTDYNRLRNHRQRRSQGVERGPSAPPHLPNFFFTPYDFFFNIFVAPPSTIH
jgi:hypothetical protein